MKRQRLAPAPIALAVALACGTAQAQQSGDKSIVLPALEVIGNTPLPGIGLNREAIAAQVQSLDSRRIADPASANLPDLLNRELGSVHINEVQGNAYQPDINYRGFTASPLLGTPQGLSIYLDGVRLNQPFGDVVSWDLIPRSAIASMSMMPGSNPLFGLNTLGGALAIQTKDGLSHPGTAVQAVLGSQQRKSLEFEHGGSNARGLHWFMTGNAHRDEGWRDDSPTRIGQIFGKLGWVDSKTDLSLTLAAARTNLTGNGLQEERLLARDYNSVYTKPDETHNRSIFLNLSGKHALSDDLILSGNAYFRKIRTRTLNGDINEDSLDQSVYQTTAAERAALTAAGYSGFPSSGASASNTPFPYWRCIANTLLKDEPAEKCNGLLNRTETTQENYGLSLQLSGQGKFNGLPNQWTLGGGYDASRMHFKQTAQFGYLNPDRSVTPVNFFADGTELDDTGQPIDARVDLRGRNQTWSLYASDTLTLFERLYLTASGRYNTTQVVNRDQLVSGGPGSLDGDHRFSRFNPALGLTYTALPGVNVYAGYNEGSRTPTAIELGCADPANPCKLPNAMAGDPPLKQVVTKTWEAGIRGGDKHYRWHAGLFRADNHDDILFVAGTPIGYGYFRNFGQTRRQGIELGASAERGAWRFAADYTYLDASFQSTERVNGEANSSQDANGNITIRPGDRLPLVPHHILKLRSEWQATAELTLNAGMTAVSGSIARGNENAQNQADGRMYLGNSRTGGYALFDLGAKYRASRQLSFFAQINNLFDRQYATAAQLGATGFTATGNFLARPFSSVGDNTSLVHSTFYAPGAPRTGWVGVRYEFDAR